MCYGLQAGENGGRKRASTPDVLRTRSHMSSDSSRQDLAEVFLDSLSPQLDESPMVCVMKKMELICVQSVLCRHLSYHSQSSVLHTKLQNVQLVYHFSYHYWYIFILFSSIKFFLGISDTTAENLLHHLFSTLLLTIFLSVGDRILWWEVFLCAFVHKLLHVTYLSGPCLSEASLINMDILNWLCSQCSPSFLQLFENENPASVLISKLLIKCVYFLNFSHNMNNRSWNI